jgi:hypothetical protein
MHDEVFKVLPEKLRRAGNPFHPYGWFQHGWDRHHIFSVLQWGQANRLAVLGCEVVFFSRLKRDKSFSQPHGPSDVYDTAKDASESWEQFVVRSHQEAVRFISNYKEPTFYTVIYVPTVIWEEYYRVLIRIDEESGLGLEMPLNLPEAPLEPSQLSLVLADLRDTLVNYLEGEVDVGSLLHWAATCSYYSQSDLKSDKDRLRADLIDYAFGAIFSLSSQPSRDINILEHELLQIVRYINAETPFNGEFVSLF